MIGASPGLNGAAMPPSRLHVTHLIAQLRTAAADNMDTALDDADGGLAYCLGAALANDAADALEALLQASVANDDNTPRRVNGADA